MMLDSPHTSVPVLMRSNTPPTTRSPPHQSRPTGNPPYRQPATVSDGERGGRGLTSRRMPMRAASDCRPPPTARHASPPRSSTSHPPSNKTKSTGSCAPARGRGPASAQDRRAAPHVRLQAAPGPRPSRRPPRRRSPTRHVPRQQQRVGGRESRRQQPAPPPRDAAKMLFMLHSNLPSPWNTSSATTPWLCHSFRSSDLCEKYEHRTVSSAFSSV